MTTTWIWWPDPVSQQYCKIGIRPSGAAQAPARKRSPRHATAYARRKAARRAAHDYNRRRREAIENQKEISP